MDTVAPFELQRLFLGDAPPLFLAEILFRVLVIWLWTACLLRWIGGRSIAQLSIVEFLLVIALGSAVGDAMFYPEVPLLHAMLVILIVVLMDKALDYVIRRWNRAKAVIDGTPVMILREGRILCDGLTARALGRLELMEMLRLKGVTNLGQVRAAYLEPSGEISLFRFDQPRPGLRIEPPVEMEELAPAGPVGPGCCTGCGAVVAHPQGACSACGDDKAWVLPQTAP